uniref:Uncharacterized protein n=1 Tax=Oryza glumipatula TaxID=40148 RepID=A0A0E0AH59_9ORYZ
MERGRAVRRRRKEAAVEGARPCAAEVAVAVAADKSRGGERERERERGGGIPSPRSNLPRGNGIRREWEWE